MRLRYTLNNATEGEHITTYSPKGWEEMELVLKRHDKYDGVFKDFTTKVEFFCGAGKEYIDNIYDTQGIEAEVTVLIEMDCDDSGTYDTLYEGKLIMKSYEKVQAAPEYTRVNLEQDGIIQTVLNRLETTINLNSSETLDGDAVTPFTLGPYEMTMHSKRLALQGNMLGGITEFEVTAANNHNIPLAIDVEEISTLLNTSISIPDPFFVNGDSFSRTVLFSGRVRLSVRQTSTINESGTPVTYNYSGGFVVNLIIYNESNSAVSGTTVHTEPGQLTSDTVTFDFTFTDVELTVPAGYGVGITYTNTYELTLTSTPGYFVISRSQYYEYFDETYVSLYEENETDATTANVFPVFEAGADIARKITGQNDSFRSNYFGRKNSEPYSYSSNGCGSFQAITNGFQIRGFPLTGDDAKPIKLSMKDYFEGLSAIHCLGMGLKESGGNTYIEIEPKDYFYTDESLFSLSYINNLKSKVEPSLLYNRIQIGYAKWRKEGLNGLDEFCTTHNYSTLHKSISNLLEAISNFIAGPYAIERQRRLLYTESPSEDGEYDNENFIICLNRSVDGSGIPNNLTTAEKDENFTITNVFSPETIYNARISPARNMRNWLKMIGAGLIKLNDTLKTIRFTSAEGNYKMTSQGSDSCDPAHQVLIGEGDDIEALIPSPSTEFEPFFTGDVDEFEAPFSKDQYDELKELDADSKPNYFKKIRYSTTGEDFLAGYILELRYRPVKGVASFRMARAYERTEECTHIYVEAGYVECDYVE